MTVDYPLEAPSDVVAQRVQEVRRRRGWNSAERFAAECDRAGVPHLTASVIANIESGRPDGQGRRRRDVSVEELLALAYVLEVSPLDLLVRPEDDVKPYHVTPGRADSARAVRLWIGGHSPLLGMDQRRF